MSLHDLYCDLIDLPAEERTRRLQALGLSDQDRCHLLALLDTVDGPPFLTVPLDQVVAALRISELDVEAMIGRTIGTFRLIEFIGEGGSAYVFKATRPAGEGQQTVALKVLRDGGGRVADERRFRREQAILAQLSHPHIAHLIEAGIDASGLTYLALEYVDGHPITVAADRMALDFEARLRLFLDLCAAVIAAHAAMIVHCDLKPSNVLVDGEGRLKVMDFGIARLLDADGERERVVALTPQYAAPEQFRGVAPSAAFDVFALGVILTELLSGQRAGSALPERVEAMSIGELPHGLPAPRSLAALLRGDLEAIIACATDAQAGARYGSVSALADDVRHVLDCLPISLRRQHLGYRVGKFLRRYRSLVVITSSLVLGLSVSLGLAAWQAVEARRAGQLAEANARRAASMRDFVFEVLSETEPGSVRSAPASVVDAVERAIERLATQPVDARTQVELMARFAETLGRHGDPGRALALLESTRASVVAHFGEADPLIPVIDERLAFYETDIGRYDRALSRIERLLKQTDVLEAELRARVLARSAVLGWRTNDRERALRDGARILELANTDLPADTKRSLLAAYASAMLGIGEIKAATLALEQQVAAAIAAHGPVHKEVAAAYSGLSRAYRRLGDLDRAEAAIRKALAIDSQVFPEELPFVANHHNALAMIQVARRDFAGELASAERQYAINLKHLGADHTDSIIARYSIGMALVHQERFQEALPALAEALASYQRNFGVDDVRTQHALAGHGFAQAMSGDYAAGSAEMARAIARLSALPHQSNDFLARCLENRVRAALHANDLVGATDALTQLDAAIPRLPPEESTRWPPRRQVLAAALALAKSQSQQALSALAPAPPASGPTDSALAVEAELLAGIAHLELGDRAQAQSRWQRAAPMLADLRFPPARLTRLGERLRQSFPDNARH